ncbi:GNAT family N-acetyltransferase [Sphingomonas sanguinis]|uniref:GNAT family N-acetyltransferase n=1 Tax=Sphingomonas sp. LC-1 TaxID=3110957 RepID=UPI0021BA6E10|nr:GNAT family N-acetyltransferase [Sphingomonas sp. LC-1]MCT8002030.1 GNAT family N-acetyltransferase [Sphingomonas sp. LC-1]
MVGTIQEDIVMIADTELLVTHKDVRLHVRRARTEDKAPLAGFFARVSPEDLRFRFLTSVREVSHERLSGMIHADNATTESLIAFSEDGSILGAAMLAGDKTGSVAEAAIAIRHDMKQMGIGWTLLDLLVERARRRGYRTIEAIEDRENRSAILIEREMGFDLHPVEGDPTLVRLSRTLG